MQMPAVFEPVTINRYDTTFEETSAASQKIVRPDHRPPHVRSWTVVVAETFCRLAKIAIDEIGEVIGVVLDGVIVKEIVVI